MNCHLQRWLKMCKNALLMNLMCLMCLMCLTYLIYNLINCVYLRNSKIFVHINNTEKKQQNPENNTNNVNNWLNWQPSGTLTGKVESIDFGCSSINWISFFAESSHHFARMVNCLVILWFSDNFFFQFIVNPENIGKIFEWSTITVTNNK